MSLTLRPPHRSHGRCRPRLERLETRLPLSASAGTTALETLAAAGPHFAFDSTAPSQPVVTGVVATVTSPADAQTPPVSAVTVTFNRPLAPFSLGTHDLQIDQRLNNSWANAFLPSNAPAQSLDATGTQLTLTFAQPLAPGDYRVVLPVTTGLSYTDGTRLAGPGADQVLGSFTVERRSLTLGDASTLDSPVSSPVSARGALDLQNDPGAVALYKFTLPEGHHWKLGAEVLAQQIGSGLRSNLTLFNAQGVPIATTSTGRPNAPADPFLIEGLAPGTYYIGLSGAGNVPGTDTGYNPATGAPAANLPTQAGGSYQLHIVADPADAPTRVLGFSLQFADPIDPHPTGFALAFSAPLNANTFLGIPSRGVELVDGSGRTFPVTAVAQHETSAQYFFLVNEDLPAGHYSVVVPDGGLTDLTGYTPVATGQPLGVLASFDVSGTTDPNPHDLGPVYDRVFAGVSRTDVVAPGTGVTYRFVATFEGTYKLQTQSSGGSLTFQALGPDCFLQDYDNDSPGETLQTEMYLRPGVYYLQFQNAGLTPATLRWTLRDLATPQSFESLLNNGLGQGSALSVMSFSGSAAGLSGSGAMASSSTAWSGQPAVGVFSTSVTAGQQANTSITPGGLLLTLGNTLVGRPSTEAEHVSAVGPIAVSLTSSPALASVGQSLLPGIGYGPTPSGRSASPSGRPTGESSTPVVQPAPVNGALAAEDEAKPDRLVIADADWLTRAGNAAARLFALAPADESAPEMPDETVEARPIALVRDDSPAEPRETDRVERAQFGAPMALGVATLMSLRLNPPFLRWVRRNRSRPSSSPTKLRGPHTRF